MHSIPQSSLDIPARPFDSSGASCDLYVGEHDRFGRVALKRLRCTESEREDAVRRFTREANTWSELDHPHVLKFYGVCETPQDIFLVSPFVEYGSLRRYLGLFPDADRARLIYETALAIDYLHRKGVIHGDIKGLNILVSEQHTILLCDFGLAKLFDSATSVAQKDKGTLRWQSQEILDGAPKSYASDVYAFGITIYEVLSGRLPFDNYDLSYSVIKAVTLRHERPPKEPTSSPNGASYAPLWHVAERAWAHEPSDRPSIFEVLPLLSLAVQSPWPQSSTSTTISSGASGTSSFPAPSTSETEVIPPERKKGRSRAARTGGSAQVALDSTMSALWAHDNDDGRWRRGDSQKASWDLTRPMGGPRGY